MQNEQKHGCVLEEFAYKQTSSSEKATNSHMHADIMGREERESGASQA